MCNKVSSLSGVILPIFICVFLLPQVSFAENEVVPFDSARWELKDAEVVQHLGREALIGKAVLRDVEMENGVVEFDLAVTGARSYPGAIFRMQSQENYEYFYIRPHRAGICILKESNALWWPMMPPLKRVHGFLLLPRKI